MDARVKRRQVAAEAAAACLAWEEEEDATAYSHGATGGKHHTVQQAFVAGALWAIDALASAAARPATGGES